MIQKKPYKFKCDTAMSVAANARWMNQHAGFFGCKLKIMSIAMKTTKTVNAHDDSKLADPLTEHKQNRKTERKIENHQNTGTRNRLHFSAKIANRPLRTFYAQIYCRRYLVKIIACLSRKVPRAWITVAANSLRAHWVTKGNENTDGNKMNDNNKFNGWK